MGPVAAGQCALQEPDAGEVLGDAGAPTTPTTEPGRKALPPAVSLQRPLAAKLNIMPESTQNTGGSDPFSDIRQWRFELRADLMHW